MDLVTVDLRLSYEMSYDSRLFLGGLRIDWCTRRFLGRGGI
jgi:hypothetical protein